MNRFFEDVSPWFGGRGPHERGRGRGRGRGGWGGPGGPGGPGWRGGWPGFLGERPPRAERGGVRYLVLDALKDTPRHGYEIMAAIEEKSGGTYRPSPGVIYPTLQMLEELGQVKATERDDKKVYTLTAAGQKELAEHTEDVESFYEQSEDVWDDHGDALRDVMERVRRLMRAFRRTARRGRLSPARMAKVRAILDDAVTKLEALGDE